MKRYCFDTSGISNPIESMPEDIYVSVWRQVRAFFESGQVAVTREIYDEMLHLPGEIGECVKRCRSELLLEVGDDTWDWPAYTHIATQIVARHLAYISEYNGGVKKTVGMNDISIIALAKALGVPVVSMETALVVGSNLSPNKRRIPDICRAEGVVHLQFNEFLRLEQIQG